MGVRGAAVATVMVHTVSLLALVVYTETATPEHELFRRFWRPDREAFGTVFRLGWPIGITTVAEVGLFAMSSLMMGWIGPLHLAAHGIAIQVASVVFMIHLGLSNTATIRAGRAIGRGDAQGLRDGALVVTALSGLAALVTIAIIVAIPGPLIGLFVDPADPDRPRVIEIGTVLLYAAALFQLVDAAQVMALGLLRGVQDTRVPMIYAAISYWLIGVPCSYVLGFVLGWEGPGIWLGLAAGLAAASVFMMTRFWHNTLPAALRA
jgi:MATE family multidrug resistance protein